MIQEIEELFRQLHFRGQDQHKKAWREWEAGLGALRQHMLTVAASGASFSHLVAEVETGVQNMPPPIPDVATDDAIEKWREAIGRYPNVPPHD